MPIYAYRCASCGHAQDVLQKLSDAVLTVCPVCGAAAYAKQVTAAGFQLKGSGWYVTDFRDGAKATTKTDDAAAKAPDKATTDQPAADKPAAETKAAEKPATTTAAPPSASAPPTPSTGS